MGRFLKPLVGVPFVLGFGLGLFALVIAPAMAFAQTATSLDEGALFGQATPYIEGLATVAAGVIVGLLSWLLYRVLGVTLDAKYRTMLQGALENAAHGLIADAQGRLNGRTIDIKSVWAVDAINYLRSFVPDALKHFGLDDAGIVALLEKQVAKILPKDVTLGTA